MGPDALPAARARCAACLPTLLAGILAASLGHLGLAAAMRPFHSARDALLFSLYLAVPACAAFAALRLLCKALARLRRWGPESEARLATGAAAFLILAPFCSATLIVATRPFYARAAGDAAALLGVVAGCAAVAFALARSPLAALRARAMVLVPLGAAAFVAPAAAVALAAQERRPPPAADLAPDPRAGSPRILVVGFDGLTWDVLQPLLDAGRVPNFARVAAAGSRAVLRSEVAPNQPFVNCASRGMRTPVAWETIATGRSPRDHGIWDFYATPLPGLRRALPFRVPGLPRRPVLSTDGREPRVWEILDRAGRSSLVVNWVDTWPALPLERGTLVSDRTHWEDRGLTAPPELAREFAAFYRDYPRAARELFSAELDPGYLLLGRGDPEYTRNRDLKRRLDQATDEAFGARYCAAARAVIGLDVEADFARRYRPPDPRYWQNYLLFYQGKELDKDEFYAAIAERLLGEARARGSPPDLAACYFSSTDTAAHWFWQFHEPERYPAVDPGLVERLGAVIPRVYEHADALLGRLLAAAGGDVTVVLVSDHGNGAWPELFAGWDPFGSGEAHAGYSGNHREEGVLLAAGPGIRRGSRAPELSIYDVAPLLLHLAGLPVAEDMPGRVPEEILAEEARAARPVRRIPDHGPRALPAALGALEGLESADVIQQRLDQLGY